MDPAALLVLSAAEAILEALDGRPQTWLVKRTGINVFHLNRVLKGHHPCTRELYEKCLPYLPTLPPWPEQGANERAEPAA